MKVLLLTLATLLGWVLWPSTALSEGPEITLEKPPRIVQSVKDPFPRKYDLSFKKWSGMYNPSLPWYWLKAQCYQESLLKPNAVSPVGAKGLCQFMDFTAKDEMKKLGVEGGDVFNPALNIQMAASYMKQLRNIYKAPRPEYDRHSLAMASYNAGAGNIIKAQKLAGNSLLWEPTKDKLHLVTGHHSNETKTYVERIWEFIARMEDNDPWYYK